MYCGWEVGEGRREERVGEGREEGGGGGSGQRLASMVPDSNYIQSVALHKHETL